MKKLLLFLLLFFPYKANAALFDLIQYKQGSGCLPPADPQFCASRVIDFDNPTTPGSLIVAMISWCKNGGCSAASGSAFSVSDDIFSGNTYSCPVSGGVNEQIDICHAYNTNSTSSITFNNQTQPGCGSCTFLIYYPLITIAEFKGPTPTDPYDISSTFVPGIPVINCTQYFSPDHMDCVGTAHSSNGLWVGAIRTDCSGSHLGTVVPPIDPFFPSAEEPFGFLKTSTQTNTFKWQSTNIGCAGVGVVSYGYVTSPAAAKRIWTDFY